MSWSPAPTLVQEVADHQWLVVSDGSAFSPTHQQWIRLNFATHPDSRDHRLGLVGHWSMGTRAVSALQQEPCKTPTLSISVRIANSSSSTETKSEIT